MSEFNQARREGVVKFGYDFDSLAEVTHLFGLKATKLPHTNRFRIPGRENAIVCLLSANGGNGWKIEPHYGMKCDDRGWREILRIDEYNEDSEISDSDISGEDVVEELKNPQERYVFWRESRDGVKWYKFYGVFEIDRVSTHAELAAMRNVCIYRRKSLDGDCPRLEYEALPEIGNLEGKVIEANLLDCIPYELAGDTQTTGEVKVLPGQRFWIKEASVLSQNLVCQTADSNILHAFDGNGEATFFIPWNDLLGRYFKVIGEGTLEDARDNSENDIETVVDKRFDEFWDEFCGWWDISKGEEEMTFKRGKTEYKLRCSWDDDTLIAAMVAPWPGEWDFARLYRGMFGRADIGDGFYSARLRKKVAKLLLDEIIKRWEWKKEHYYLIGERGRDIEQEAKDRGYGENQMPYWCARYWWVRKHSDPDAGEMRLYVPGINRLFGAPIMCEWAIQDMG